MSISGLDLYLRWEAITRSLPMSLNDLHYWKPNKDNTYGPYHWTKEELYKWASKDKINTYRELAYVILAIGVCVLSIFLL